MINNKYVYVYYGAKPMSIISLSFWFKISFISAYLKNAIVASLINVSYYIIRKS